MADRTCSVEGCAAEGAQAGMCWKHYSRVRRHGDPHVTTFIKGDDEARWFAKVDQNGPVPAHRPDLGPCWLWLAGRRTGGYAGFQYDGRNGGAHVWGFEHFIGPVPEGLELDHLCRVRHCVNPRHLEPVTHAENVRRSVHPVLTHCQRGHPFDEDNTYFQPGGKRGCRACRNLRARLRRATRRSA